MTKNKDEKRLVRVRMRKTGESYTAARAALIRKRSSTENRYAAPREQWAELAGKSDASVRERTGRTWTQWVRVLDKARAHTMTHRDIARHLVDTYEELSPWWAQTVAVGYERIRGLREVGQQCDGQFAANKCRTLAVDVSTLYRMFRDAQRRKKWLPEGVTRIRASIVDKSIRVDWHDGTQVNFYFVPKSNVKCTVAVQHAKLTSRDDVEKMKSFWAAKLDALAAALR